jgi:hypothetical protein
MPTSLPTPTYSSTHSTVVGVVRSRVCPIALRNRHYALVVDWESLPDDIRDKVVRLGPSDPREFIAKPIPALGGQSICKVLAEPDGEERVREYLLRAIGYFG